MSIHVPEAGWFKAPSGGERIWIGLALLWCVVLSLAMPYWHLKGKQNSTGESYSVKPLDFMDRVERFVQQNKIGEQKGVAVVEPAPGTDAYLLAQMWRWYPVLKLKQGVQYTLHLSSLDINHGFNLYPVNLNFQVIPGYDYGLKIVPNKTGDFRIVCNEFCGINHHMMVGKVIVE